ncbi:MAG TPA: alkaline phosphatase family protein [Nocardioides sp.]|uniref:alkaline phosphatase family protein n=1 Tax=Nocardioides sp. TaxID=35761 RepID=UPI002E32E4A6|nr:alkaline phosphatase family protein [Nocardioides sp.]HEX5090048.1 alkaline phosphatase family protein [Nocardioides sp.]
MVRRTRPLLAVVAAAAVTVALTAGANPDAVAKKGHHHHQPAKPDKVVVILVDALSKEIVHKYHMKNVESLMKKYVDTPRGYLGHLGSVTVVTHNVVTSGQLPKHMGWTDEGYRDVANLLPDTTPQDSTDDFYITSDFGSSDMFKLQSGYPKLADYLGAADPTAKTFTISPKGYAGWAFGGPGSDSIITFGSGADCTTSGSLRPPAGINVPSYILGEPCSRFWVHNGYPQYAYDTTKLPAVMYPLDSDRYVTGHDAAHQGGDVWAADAAIAIMRNEKNWNGIFVTLPGVDKAAHMWGGVADPGPTGADGDAMTHLKAAAATADAQVGKIINELRRQGELDDTLVVLTADHGSVAGKHYYGKLVAEKDYGYYNWYYGDPENDKFYDRPQDALLPLVNTGNIGLSYSDSMLRVWLKDQSPVKVAEAAAIMKDMPAVTAVWRRNGDHYDRVTPIRWDRMHSLGEKLWFAQHAQELVDTEAAVYGPDLIATLPDDTTYSIAGDHGGIQRASQQIPIVFAGAALSKDDIYAPVRSVDIMPTILKAMGITPTFPMDGVAYKLPTKPGRH